MDAVGKDMLLILYIMSIAQVVGRKGVAAPNLESRSLFQLVGFGH